MKDAMAWLCLAGNEGTSWVRYTLAFPLLDLDKKLRGEWGRLKPLVVANYKKVFWQPWRGYQN